MCFYALEVKNVESKQNFLGIKVGPSFYHLLITAGIFNW